MDKQDKVQEELKKQVKNVEAPEKPRGDISSRMKRYFYNRTVLGLNKKDSALKAGYAESTAHNVKPVIEDTKAYRYLLHMAFPKEEMFHEHRKNIKQDDHLTAKNQALKMAYELMGVLPNKDKDKDDSPELRVIIDRKG